MDEKWKKVAKCIVFILLAGALVWACVRFCVPLTKLLATEEGRAEICGRVETFGIFAPLIFLLLMAVQIIIAFIPGGPLEIVGGMLFGGWNGVLFTTLGTLLGTLTVYGLVKRFGRPLVQLFVNEKRIQKFHFLQDEERLSFWVFVLFLIPGIPKDMLTYLVPLTRMEGRRFVLLSTLARFPSLVASVLVGDSLADGRYWLSVTICAIGAVAVFLGYQFRNHIMKEHKKKS